MLAQISVLTECRVSVLSTPVLSDDKYPESVGADCSKSVLSEGRVLKISALTEGLYEVYFCTKHGKSALSVSLYCILYRDCQC